MVGLQEVCTVQLDLAPEAHGIDSETVGSRRAVVIQEGAVLGERLSGFVLPGIAEWRVFDEDWGRLDVRMLWEMDEGATIYVRATGVVNVNGEGAASQRDRGRHTV